MMKTTNDDHWSWPGLPIGRRELADILERRAERVRSSARALEAVDGLRRQAELERDVAEAWTLAAGIVRRHPLLRLLAQPWRRSRCRCSAVALVAEKTAAHALASARRKRITDLANRLLGSRVRKAWAVARGRRIRAGTYVAH